MLSALLTLLPCPALAQESLLLLSDALVTLNGQPVGTEGSVYLSHDIIYYEDRDTYASGLPYGEGTDSEKHSAEEAAAHTVIHITAPGVYRVSGQMSQGQLCIDLGDGAETDLSAVVTLILDNLDITCTVAPAILFLEVYECDHGWTLETASPDVDTSRAGANVILADGSVNTVTGSHVARIYKDEEGEKKRCKFDGAFYSCMSINIGAEGDGIDSNGWLVIRGGTVIASANPAADAGLDSDMGSFIHGGTVVALGSTMDWAESDSEQVTMNLQFAAYNDSGDAIVIQNADGSYAFAYDPSEDEVVGSRIRRYMGAVVSSPAFALGSTCHVFIGGELTGEEHEGVYEGSAIASYEGGAQQAYTGTDVTRFGGHGFGGGRGRDDFGSRDGMGGERGQRGFDGERPEMPEGGFDRPEGMTPPEIPSDGETPPIPDGMIPPEMPDGETPPMPEGMTPPEMPDGPFSPFGAGALGEEGEPSADFYLQDKVNAYSGVKAQ